MNAKAERSDYMSIPADKVYPKHRIVFKSGKHLNVFGVTKIDLSGSWVRLWDGEGDLYTYEAASVDYIQIKDKK